MLYDPYTMLVLETNKGVMNIGSVITKIGDTKLAKLSFDERIERLKKWDTDKLERKKKITYLQITKCEPDDENKLSYTGLNKTIVKEILKNKQEDARLNKLVEGQPKQSVKGESCYGPVLDASDDEPCMDDWKSDDPLQGTSTKYIDIDKTCAELTKINRHGIKVALKTNTSKYADGLHDMKQWQQNLTTRLASMEDRQKTKKNYTKKGTNITGLEYQDLRNNGIKLGYYNVNEKPAVPDDHHWERDSASCNPSAQTGPSADPAS